MKVNCPVFYSGSLNQLSENPDKKITYPRRVYVSLFLIKSNNKARMQYTTRIRYFLNCMIKSKFSYQIHYNSSKIDQIHKQYLLMFVHILRNLHVNLFYQHHPKKQNTTSAKRCQTPQCTFWPAEQPGRLILIHCW